jgi:hypothetical protein
VRVHSQLYASVSGQNRQGGRAVKAQQNCSSEWRVRDRNMLCMFCDVKNRRQAYGLINAETAIITIIWNSLPEDNVPAPSMSAFENRLDKVMLEYMLSLEMPRFLRNN